MSNRPAIAEQTEYVLGANEAELQRLGFQHRVWGEYAYAIWERAGFRPGHTLVDVGCGPGYGSFDLAGLVGPAGKVIAVDVAEEFINHLRRQAAARGVSNIEPHVGNVESLDLPAGQADGAYARWVLCFVPDPRAVIEGVARALRPGGAFAIQDYVHYRSVLLAPRSAAFEKAVAATDRSWRERGGDPDIAMRLPSILVEAGFEIREVRSLVRADRPGTLLWHWPQTFFAYFIPRLIEMGLLTPADQREFAADWAARSADPGAFFVTPPMVDILAVKR